ncbi:hypothetical protein PSTEL_23495 [Paenibacillus stellifer]|uniref:Major facilitator superfamily (MFS) profile domain-containing protein n=1 Tax=Paenibacillus stellifer TaxID=169760 RepID=A0A089LZQ5_9BACL|nr:MFS transporter [Paenibacillus stellifer]AIQ65630.1 hypothetical protein PSTEL_23495 [Paenibacillus stellifer]
MKISKEQALTLAFTFLAFILGTTEYVIVGLLDQVAAGLGVSIAEAGAFVSGFAVAYACGTPFAMALAGRFSKPASLMTGTVLVVLLNICSAFASTYVLLLVFRIMTAVCCGLCVSLSISISTDVVPIEKRGRAISYIMGGFSLANVLGVPIGTFVGMHFEWPAAFILVGILGAFCLVLLYRVVPRDLPNAQSRMSDQFRLLTHPRVLLAILIPVLGVAAIFVNYTYIVPLMTEVMRIPADRTGYVLIVYGAATIFSNIISGVIASGNYMAKLKVLFLIQAVIFAIYGITVSVPWLGILGLIAIACISFSINAAVPIYFIHLAERFVPAAKDFASSLMPIGANIGIAVGSASGALVMGHFGLRFLPWAAVGFALVSCCVTALSLSLDEGKGRSRTRDASL